MNVVGCCAKSIAENVRGFALCGLLAIRFDTEENVRFNFFKNGRGFEKAKNT